MSSWSPASGGWSNYIPSKQGVAKTVSGLGGVASGVYGAVSNSVPSGQGYLSSLPAGLKRLSDLLPTGESCEHGTGDRDEVVTVAFDLDTGPAKHLHFLNVCFRNGFQIWEVLDSDEDGTQATRETQPLREVVSVRLGYTHLVKVLSTVEVTPDSPLHGKQPAVAIVAGDEPGDLNVVRLFSLPENDCVHHMRFHGDVHAVTCNRHRMIVCLKNQLILHKMDDLSPVQTLSTFPSPTPQGVLALGARWLAYAPNQPLRTVPDDESNTDPYNTYGSAYLDIGVAAASTAALGAMQLGGLGLRTLNSYLGSSPPMAQAPDQPSEYAGTVMVRDLQNQSVVHHFKAHEGPVSIIRFDPSGLLLATAAVDGHNINVFQIDTSHLHSKTKSNVPKAPRHLYKLVRGMTSAIIDDLSFSPDTRWISVTTRSRTAHLYAINGDGSHATVETHVPSPHIDAAWPLYPSSASYAASTNTPITLFAVQRIKQREHLPASVMSRTLSTNKGVGVRALSSSCTRFAIPGYNTSFSQFPAAAGGIFIVTGEGAGVVLATYHLTPFCKEDPDTLAQTLFLEAECQGTMDICRRRSWREQECNAQRLSSWTKAAQDNFKAVEDGQGGTMPEWVSNVEIYTHERGEDAVWGSKNIRFKSFKKVDSPPTNGPPAFIEQLETVAVGGRAEEGAMDPDLEDYFLVMGPGSRTGPAASPHMWPVCPPPAPDVLRLHAPDSSPGVYGGLPSSFGSSQGTPPVHDARAHGQGREPAGAGSFGNSGGKTAAPLGGYGCRVDGNEEDKARSSKRVTVSTDDLQLEEGLFEMDLTPAAKDAGGWESDGDWEDAGCGSQPSGAVAGGENQAGEKQGKGLKPGPVASTMLSDDDDDPEGNDFFQSGKQGDKKKSGVCGSARVDGRQISAPRAKNAIECLEPAAAASKHTTDTRRTGDGSGVRSLESEIDSWAQESSPERDDKDGKGSASSEGAESGYDDKYDGDGSAKGDNDTPLNSFSPSGGLEALKNMRTLHMQLHAESSSKHVGPEAGGDWDDNWGELMSTAALRSPKRPERGVKLSGLRAEEEEAGPAVSKESGAGDKDNSSAPDTSEAEGLSSGMESGDKESGLGSSKKKKKKKSKK